jgi:hypothetical protein
MYKILTDTSNDLIRGYILTVPTVASFVIAELFYKWGSFGLELVGFLATWFAIDYAWTKLTGGSRVQRIQAR